LKEYDTNLCYINGQGNCVSGSPDRCECVNGECTAKNAKNIETPCIASILECNQTRTKGLYCTGICEYNKCTLEKHDKNKCYINGKGICVSGSPDRCECINNECTAKNANNIETLCTPSILGCNETTTVGVYCTGTCKLLPKPLPINDGDTLNNATLIPGIPHERSIASISLYVLLGCCVLAIIILIIVSWSVVKNGNLSNMRTRMNNRHSIL
jgi:hypothetical protein